jgi:predicted enzyme related to lactoylglutathione lyase
LTSQNAGDVTDEREEFRMGSGISTVIYPVKDLAAATRLYTTLLGVAPYAEQPYYVGFRVGEQEVGLDPSGHEGATAPVPYVEVADIRQSLRALIDAGAQEQRAVTDVGGGKLIATVADLDGNVTGLMQNP